MLSSSKISPKIEDDIEEKKDHIKKCMFEQAELSNANSKLLEDIEGLNKELEELQDAGEKLKKLGGLRGKIQQKISTLTKNHKFFTENAVCPTCTQDISEDMKDDKISELNKEAKKLKKGFADLESTIAAEEKREEEFTKISKNLLQHNRQVSDNISSHTNLQKNISSLESDIAKIRDSIENQDESKEKLKSTVTNLNKIKDEITDLNVEMEKHKFIGDLLKDGGVKSSIIKKYIPLINKNVNKYLQMMEFYINFNLDEEFNETVVSPIHEKFSYSSFSEGEKMRIDLALLFTS